MVQPLSDEASIEVAPGVDFQGLQLNQTEGFVLSRALFGKQSVKELVASTGLPAADARKVIQELCRRGLCLVNGEALGEGGAAALPSSPGRAADPYVGIRFPRAALDESCDLSDTQKKRILYVEMHLEKWSHYALLGLKRTAEASDVKRGYFKASKEFHPDAYFRKDLGSFRARVDRIFRAMKSAYDLLSSEEARRKYDESLGFDFTPEELAELEARAAVQRRQELEQRANEELAKQDAERTARLETRLKSRRLQRNPLLERMRRARELLTLAEQAKEAGKHLEAIRHAKLAREYAQKDEALQEQATEIIRGGEYEQAKLMLRRASTMLDRDPAADVLELVVGAGELAAKNGEMLAQVAEMFVRCGMTPRALRFAQLAVDASPDNLASWETLYRLCEQEEKWHIGLRAAERIAELLPGDKEAKERVKQVKRNIR